MPVPMMPPMPSNVRCVAFNARRSWLPEDSCSCSSAMDLVARSWRAAMGPPFLCRGLYTSTLWKASQRAPPVPCARSARPQLRRHVRREQLDQRRVNFGRAADDVSSLSVLRAIERADVSARLLDEQRARGRVPRAQADLPERIDSAGGDVGEVEGRRAGTPHARGLQAHRAQHVEISLEMPCVGAVGEAGGDQRALEPARLA